MLDAGCSAMLRAGANSRATRATRPECNKPQRAHN